MVLDRKGLHFSSKDCLFDVDITISDLYFQLASLSGQLCSSGTLAKRLDDISFNQTLYLKDQCDNPVGRKLRPYPRLKVGSTECTDTTVNATTGQWDFDCTFPGDESKTLRCQVAVQDDLLDFLFLDPFGGACPDLVMAVTTLNRTSSDFISSASFQDEMNRQKLNDTQKLEADTAASRYEDLWDVFVQTLAKNATPPFRGENGERITSSSKLLQYINVYNRYRDFSSDMCEDLHLDELPLKLSLDAGATHISSVTTLNWAPGRARPYNITIQDPNEVACCSPGSVSSTSSTNNKTCSYPPVAVIPDTGCLCGKTMDGRSIAFKYVECDNFVGTCNKDADCANGSIGSGYVCLMGSCCGGGVCIDPYACAQNGTELVTLDGGDV